jgi:7,8-dihydropterin-6-yl-methyl-4-(beta-D-ribofuranosyl)aminobenzene 5'-phosphate synthase
MCDNSVGPISGTLGEHGFSALIERDDESFLFDTGAGLTLIHNSLRMNKDLKNVSAVIISHGHYDHTGGLKEFLLLAGRKKVFAHPDLFRSRFRVKDTTESIPIGIPFNEDYLQGIGAEFDFDSNPRAISPSFFLTGEVKRIFGFEEGDKGLFSDSCGCEPDLLPDDQSLVIAAEKGLVILLGCCHAGITNTIHAAQNITGVKQIQAIVGGTHLGFCDEQQLNQSIEALRNTGFQKLYCSHCTGFYAAARLHREFPGKVFPAMVGTSIEFA